MLMADLYLMPTNDGGEIEIVNGKPTMTDGLLVSVYLSLFTPPWWGNSVSEPSEQFSGNLSDVLNEPLTLQTRLDVIAAGRSALQWLIDNGIAKEIDVQAEIVTASALYILVTVTQPSGEVASQRYGMNWDAQAVEVL
jgi:phage gp46-like protein